MSVQNHLMWYKNTIKKLITKILKKYCDKFII